MYVFQSFAPRHSLGHDLHSLASIVGPASVAFLYGASSMGLQHEFY